MKTVIISSATFIVLSFLQYVLFNTDIFQTLKDDEALAQAEEFLESRCTRTQQLVMVYPNNQRVPDYSFVYNCDL